MASHRRRLTSGDTPEAAPALVRVREMGLSPAEFRRGLARLAPDFTDRGEWLSIALPPGRVRIRLTPGPERVLGALRIPSTEVRFEFLRLDPPRADAFLAQLDRRFHRGGG